MIIFKLTNTKLNLYLSILPGIAKALNLALVLMLQFSGNAYAQKTCVPPTPLAFDHFLRDFEVNPVHSYLGTPEAMLDIYDKQTRFFYLSDEPTITQLEDSNRYTVIWDVKILKTYEIMFIQGNLRQYFQSDYRCNIRAVASYKKNEGGELTLAAPVEITTNGGKYDESIYHVFDLIKEDIVKFENFWLTNIKGVFASFFHHVNHAAIIIQNPESQGNQLRYGDKVNASFLSSGGLAPYSYTFSTGLPSGMGLSQAGILSGTPSVVGSFVFWIRSTDANGCSGEFTTTLTIGKGSQAITFPAIANKACDDAPFNVVASASSGLPVTFTVAGNSTELISITNNLVTPLKSGSATIIASQPGNDVYNAATPDSVSFNILPKPVQNLLLTSVCSSEPTVQRKWRVRNDNSFAVSYTWEVYPNLQTGTGIAQPGDNFFLTNTVDGANTTKLFWQDENDLQKEVVKASSGERCTLSKLIFTSMCSDNPSISRTWRIRNPNTTSLNVDWEVYGTTQKGTVVAPKGDSFFNTQTVANSPNTTKIYWRNEKGERKSLTKASGGGQCAASARFATDDSSEEVQSGTLSVHPNPGSKQITITYSSEHETAMSVQIISATGVLQSQNYHQLRKGVNVLMEDVSRLSAGIYLIKVGLETTRFVKE